MDGYKVDAKTIKWAEKKNRALRRAILEIPGAITSLKKANSAMKKASDACKDFPEGDVMGSYALDIGKILSFLTEDVEDWQNDADQIQLGIFNFKAEEGSE